MGHMNTSSESGLSAKK